ncbi:Drug/metabolite transporter [Cynara cardunculus var. scolymus]|uniref:WAT1-related protein n=1 Tax=Cynara cardunculus var. scolymus TaxID=59895 RepID=A0A103Y4R7_CYNCS|nr:Drug/metabolite transporter [Cynara cardunculus var. scolymus]
MASNTWSWMEDVLPFVVMMTIICLDMSILTIVKAAMNEGVNYSSPTMASAISNLMPAITFLIAGPEIIKTILSPETPNQLLLSQPSNWVFGGLIIVIAVICGSSWNVLQTATAREYPDELTVVFFFCLFGTIQSIALSLVLEQNPSAWVLQPGIKIIAVVWGAVFSIVFRSNAVTWCLRKKGPVFVAMFSPLSIVIAVIMGVTFLGDSLYLGSAIGAAIVAAGFYTVMWGHAKEKNKLPTGREEDLDIADESGSSNQKTPLLSSMNESKC